MFKSISLAGFMVLLLTAGTVSAADLRTSSGNIYTADSQVSVDQAAGKDLVVGGGMVIVNSKVGRDLLAGAGNLTVTGDVVGSVRVAGGTINISSKSIGEDLVIGGGNVLVGPDTVVNGDVLIAAGNATIEGTVHGSVRFVGGTLVLNGRVDGNVNARAKQYFTLGSKADIKGNINYTSRTQYNRDANAKVGGTVTYSHLDGGRAGLGALLTLAMLIKLLAMIITSFIVFAIWKHRFTERSLAVGNGFWKNAGIGLLGAIAIPIVIALLFVTVVGYYAAFMLILIYLLLWMTSALFAGAYLGGWIVSKIDKRPLRIDYVTIALGMILFTIVALVPIIGALAIIILALAGFGALLRNYKNN